MFIAAVTGFGSAGTITGETGKITVALYSDNAGIPGSLIAILGQIQDTAILPGTTGVVKLPLVAPVLMAANTRYWIQLSGNSSTTTQWVQAGDPLGVDVANEGWYSDGINGENISGPSYQMAVIAEGTNPAAVGSVGTPIIEASAQIAGVSASGSAGIVGINGWVLVSLYSDDAGAPGSLIAVLGEFDDTSLIPGTQSLVKLSLSSAIALTPNTRYWIQLSGNRSTEIQWAQAGDHLGIGVAGEAWSEDVAGIITDGENSAGPSYQMDVIAEQSNPVAYGQAGNVTISSEIVHDGNIVGVSAVGGTSPVVVTDSGVLQGVQGIGSADAVVGLSFGSIFAIPLNGVTGIGSAGLLSRQRQYKRRSGGGSSWGRSQQYDEPLSVKMARWRNAVEEVLEIKPKEEEIEAKLELDLSFLALLDALAKPPVDAEPITSIVEKSRLWIIAEADDEMLLGVSDDAQLLVLL